MAGFETHPSYGMLMFSRTSSSDRTLFGSSIKHNNTITMTLKEGGVERDLNHDFYIGEKMIAEVEMSQSQFAELITSMNCGDGVPVTIRWLRGIGNIEPCPFIDKRMQFEDEFSNSLEKTNQISNDIIDKINELFSKKGTITKAEKNEIISLLNRLQQEIGVNRAFIFKQFNKQMDKTAHEAKGEIEAFMQNKLNSLAAQALYEHNKDIQEKLSEIQNPVAIDEDSDN